MMMLLMMMMMMLIGVEYDYAADGGHEADAAVAAADGDAGGDGVVGCCT